MNHQNQPQNLEKKPPKPIPKPRVLSKRPFPVPRRVLPKPIDEKVKKLIDEITPYYKPEAIQKFNKLLKPKESLKKIITEMKKALRRAVQSYEVAIIELKDPARQLHFTKLAVADELRNIFNKNGAMKANINLNVAFTKISVEGEEPIEADANFNSEDFTILDPVDIIEFLDRAAEKILNIIAEWISKGSGWTIKEVSSHYLNIVKYLPLRGNSYIQLPKELRNSMKGLINLQNKDDKCFLWSHVRHLNPRKKNPQRITKDDIEFAKGLDYSGITYPVSRNQISRIEKQNKINIYVFGYDTDRKAIYPIYPTHPPKDPYYVSLDLFHIEGKNELGEDTNHYVLISDFDRLMYNFTKHKDKKHFCRGCLQCFYSTESLVEHRKYCKAINGVQANIMPEKYQDKNGVWRSPCVYFKNHHKTLPVPFGIYADFECTTEKISGCQPPPMKKPKKGRPPEERSYTEKYQRHTACSFGYKVVCHYDEKYSRDLVIYRGEDCIQKFMKDMFEEVKNCQEVIREHFNKPLIMSKKDKKAFYNAKRCHICKKKYREDEEPVRDHCHVTGKYRGSAHQSCNLKLQISAEKNKIPVIFHNLKGYDSHFIINELGEFIKRQETISDNGYIMDEEGKLVRDETPESISVNLIAQNSEKYMAFYIGKHLAFIDSFAFLSSSLDKLSSNLEDDDYIYTKKYYNNPAQFNLVKRKGVYPYDYMDSFSKFNETELPPIEEFYSQLTDTNISEEDYNHAKDVWNTFRLKNMGEYHDLYLKTDVLLLVDVLENFRKTCLTYYGLDPLHYISAPALAWDAMLKMTGINLELLTDIDMQLFIEKGSRSGISYIAHRHAEANNKYMKNFNPMEL